MNARIVVFAAAAAAAVLPLRASAQTDTAAVTVSVGKAGEPAPARDIPPGAVPRARRNLNTITYEEVRATHVSSAYELVHSLRPSWLRTPRGQMSITAQIDLAVFMNGVRMGSRDALNSIPIALVRSARFYTATEARQKFGGDTSAGAIEIVSQ